MATNRTDKTTTTTTTVAGKQLGTEGAGSADEQTTTIEVTTDQTQPETAAELIGDVEVAQPANSPKLGDEVVDTDSVLADARDEALANHDALEAKQPEA